MMEHISKVNDIENRIEDYSVIPHGLYLNLRYVYIIDDFNNYPHAYNP